MAGIQGLALDASPHGINAHLPRDAIFVSLADAGIRWLRVDIDWNLVETQRGVFDWRFVDQALATTRRLGFSVLASVAYTPAWASGSSNRATPPRDPATFHDFVRTFLKRHAPAVHAVGIWNEPNLRQFFDGTRDQYLRDILLPSLRVVRETAPGLATAGPDLSSSRSPIGSWLRPVLEAAGSLLDVVTHHQYDGGDTLAGRVKEIERVRNFMAGEGHQQPLWITEIGWDRVTESEQAQLLTGVMEAMRARPWWGKTFWYDSHGPLWGILRDDLSSQPGAPKPAYFAYRDVIQPPAAKLDFRHVITLAYQRILLRPPDPGGLESFNRAMNAGLKEAQLHDALLRSPEYAQRFPDAPAAAPLRSTKPRVGAKRRKPAKKGRRG